MAVVVQPRYLKLMFKFARKIGPRCGVHRPEDYEDMAAEGLLALAACGEADAPKLSTRALSCAIAAMRKWLRGRIDRSWAMIRIPGYQQEKANRTYIGNLPRAEMLSDKEWLALSLSACSAEELALDGMALQQMIEEVRPIFLHRPRAWRRVRRLLPLLFEEYSPAEAARSIGVTPNYITKLLADVRYARRAGKCGGR